MNNIHVYRGSKNKTKIDTLGFVKFRSIFFGKAGKEIVSMSESDLLEVFNRIEYLPCRVHGTCKKNLFSDESIEDFQDKFIKVVMKQLEMKTVWVSKSKIPSCQSAKIFDNTNAVCCDRCGTNEPSRFPNKSKNGIGKTKCKLCRALDLKYTKKANGEGVVALYDQHLKLCHLEESEVAAHEVQLEVAEANGAAKAQEESINRAKESETVYDPYDISSDEVYH